MKKLAFIASAVAALTPALAFPINAGAAIARVQPDSSPNPHVVPAHPPLLRLLYSVLSAQWWKWALSQPPHMSPLFDPSGANQQNGQQGPVWFLAGNFGGTDVRTVTIPRGKFVFFPVLNAVWTTEPGVPNPLGLPDPLSVQDIRTITDFLMDGNISACTIDGQAVNHIQQFRVRSPVFSVDVQPDLAFILGYPEHVETVVTDGVWLLLAPMSRGQHTIRFTAASAHGFVLDITYNVTVQ